MTHTATPVHPAPTPQNGPHDCQHCGNRLYLHVSRIQGSHWLHWANDGIRCPR